MIFFLSFILSLCTTIRPKNRVLINSLFLFVHNLSTKLGVSLALLFIFFLDVPIFRLLYSWQIPPLYFHCSVSGSTAFIFRPLYSQQYYLYRTTYIYFVHLLIGELLVLVPTMILTSSQVLAYEKRQLMYSSKISVSKRFSMSAT